MFYGSGWKTLRYRNEFRSSRKNFPTDRLRRITAQVQVGSSGDILAGRVFLNDLTTNGLGIFLPAPLSRGEKVFIVLEQPKHLFVAGEIAWCVLYRLNTRVISAENFQYRAAIRFLFENESDRGMIARYIDELCLKVG